MVASVPDLLFLLFTFYSYFMCAINLRDFNELFYFKHM